MAFFQTLINEKQSVFKVIYITTRKDGRRKYSHSSLGSAQSTPGELLAQTKI
jgi:hypothetical protein